MQPRPARARRAGFTLIELIIVMGLFAMLFGIGVGMLGALNPGERAALGLVQNVIRSARNNAIARNAPARVRIDPAARTLQAAGMVVLGTWQFETLDLQGAGGDGVAQGGVLLDRGFLGKALSFAGAPPGSHAEMPLHENPMFDLREGFALQCALRVEHESGGRALDLGGAAGLELRPGGALRGWYKPEVQSASGVVSAGGLVAVDSAPGLWEPGRWLRVEFAYDRRLLRLLLDGVEVGRAASSDPVLALQGPLVLGDLRAPFPGAFDALVLSAVADHATVELPKTVEFAPDAPRDVVFAADGTLDREVHSGPLSIGLQYEDGAKARVVVNLHGTVE